MASKAQLAANQRNAKRSTGPKSQSGKRRAYQNARRHCLAARWTIEGGYWPEVESLASEIERKTDGLVDRLAALMIAQEQLKVQRVQAVRHTVFDRLMTEVERIRHYEHEKNCVVPSIQPDGRRDMACDALSSLVHQLMMLERYLRRAISSRDKAIRSCLCES
jgi:hypothetical protein